MIYRLQRKFIIICVVSIFSVIALIWGGLLVLNIVSLNKNMDILADLVSGGGGKFPVLFDEQFAPEKRHFPQDIFPCFLISQERCQRLLRSQFIPLRRNR